MKKSLLLFIFVIGAIVFTGCTGGRRSQEYNILSIKDIENLNTKISFKVRSGVISKALETLKLDFEAEYPYIEVEIKAASGSYDELRSSTIFDINSKNPENIPDLLIGYPDHFAEYYTGGNLVDLQYFIDSKDADVGMSDEEMADFIPSYISENKGFSKDNPTHLYGLPFNKSTEVMVYNSTALKVLFDIVNDPNSDEDDNALKALIPTTWDEVSTFGESIITKVKAGKLDSTFIEKTEKGVITYLKISDLLNPTNLKFIPFGYDSADNGFITLTRQFGGRYTERVTTAKGYVHFNNAESRAAMTYFQNMTKAGLFGTAANFGAEYNSDALKAIQVLMTVGSSAGVGYNSSEKYPYDLGVAPIPYYEADKKYVIQQGTNIGMLNYNSDEEKLASWLFMKFLLRPENTAAFAMATGGYLPVKQSAYMTEEYQRYLDDPSDDKKEYSAAAKVALIDYIEKEYIFFVDDAFNGSSTIRSEVGSIFDSVIVNGANVVDRFKEAYDALSPFVPK